MNKLPHFHHRSNVIRTLFQRLQLGQFRGLRELANGRIEIDYSPSFHEKDKTVKGRIVGETFGKVTVYLRGKQFTAIVIGE
jgi:hypothetical protein